MAGIADLTQRLGTISGRERARRALRNPAPAAPVPLELSPAQTTSVPPPPGGGQPVLPLQQAPQVGELPQTPLQQLVRRQQQQSSPQKRSPEEGIPYGAR